MKRQFITKTSIAIFGFVAVLGLGNVQAQDSKPAAPTAAASAEAEVAKGLKFEKLRKEFGVVEQNGFAHIEFPFVNVTDKTIVINEVKTSCGCTAAELSKMTFAPGEGETIKAKFSAGRRKGTQTKTIRVDTDETDGRASYDYSLVFTGEVVTLVELESSMIDFGSIDKGTEVTKSIKLFSYKDEPVKIHKVTSNLDALTFTYGEPKVSEKVLEHRPGGKVYETEVFVTVPEDMKTGQLVGNIKIATDDASMPTIDAVLRGKVIGELTAVPDNLFFGVLPPNEMTKRTVSLSSKTDMKFVLEDIVVDVTTKPGGVDSDVEVVGKVLQESLEGRPNTQVLELAFTAPEEQGRYTGDISFVGKLGEKTHSMVIPFNVYVRPSQAGANGTLNTPSIPAKLTPEQRKQKIEEMAKRLKEAKEKETAKMEEKTSEATEAN